MHALEQRRREWTHAGSSRRWGSRRTPEGGWYRETWRAKAPPGARAGGTAIHFLLEAGQRSHWHRVDADELWLWHAGDPLHVLIERNPGEIRAIGLGGDVAGGYSPQCLVPASRWQSTEGAIRLGAGELRGGSGVSSSPGSSWHPRTGPLRSAEPPFYPHYSRYQQARYPIWGFARLGFDDSLITVRRRWRLGKPKQSQELIRTGRVQVPSGNHSLARRGCSGDRTWRRRESGAGSARSGRCLARGFGSCPGGRISQGIWKPRRMRPRKRLRKQEAEELRKQLLRLEAEAPRKRRPRRADGSSVQQGFVGAPGSSEAGRRDRSTLPRKR